MKKIQYLSTGIWLINKKYKSNEYYHYFKEPNNVLVVPKFGKFFIVIQQKREPINKKNLEFPMGWVDKGERPADAAKRELLEETGYKSLIKPKKILEFFADPGRGQRSCYCFYTNKLKKIQKPEKKIKVFLKTEKEIKNLIKKKKFNNSSHISAFYHFIDKN
tara:strand:+ start:1720 stop:2205 length:486 start_codon:yes stop_codon:yes gene_type:complete